MARRVLIAKPLMWIAAVVGTSLITLLGVTGWQLMATRATLAECQLQQALDGASIRELRKGIDEHNAATAAAEKTTREMRAARDAAEARYRQVVIEYESEIDRIRDAPSSDGSCDVVRLRLIEEAAR